VVTWIKWVGVATAMLLAAFGAWRWNAGTRALLPSQGARWTAVDAHAAQVALADGAIEISLLLHFDPSSSLIDSVRAQARGRTVGQRVAMTPWEGRWWDYAEHGGMKVPMSGEVAWLTPAGRRTYWRGKVTALAYEFVR
jgi:hypothetical protein